MLSYLVQSKSLRRTAVAFACLLGVAGPAAAQTYDLVLANGRVMDPESGLDAVRNIGVRDGRIAAISAGPLKGREVLDVRGLVVAPGFIDLHSHAQDPKSNVYQAHDGVTTALEMELGVFPIDAWYQRRAGHMVINYGATVSHTVAHAAAILGLAVFDKDPDPIGAGLVSEADAVKTQRTKLTAEQTPLLEQALQQGLDQGGLGIGMGIQYMAGVDRPEVFRTFQVAGRNHAPLFVHARNAGVIQPDSIDSLEELIADSAMTGAPVHFAHIGSSGLLQAPMMLEMIDAAHCRGVDVTTEVYPYTGAMAVYGSPLLAGDWQERFAISYGDLQDVKSGQRLTEETFKRGRIETPQNPIVVYVTPQAIVDFAVVHPSVMIASDAVEVGDGQGHPRTAGTYTRVLGRYVRERKALGLMDALAKMTLMPARRLEPFAPQMARKGRIKVGADADITVFDPATVLDRATYEQPMQFAAGVVDVLVGGVPVVRGGATVEGVFPGRPVRRPVKSTAPANPGAAPGAPDPAAPKHPVGRSTSFALALSMLAMPDARSAPPVAREDVERFVDATMADLMKRTWVPGAIVTVVQGDTVLLAKGYGVDDARAGTAIDPNRTLFRIGSITKLMTTVAALRLAEQGRLDLDADVNRYLTTVRLPLTFAEPFTARRLMTHRGGFETAIFHLTAPTDAATRMTPAEMQRELVRVRPPTAAPLYDNLGFGVLGLVGADILKQPYGRVLQQEVFQPLGMSHSLAGLPADRVAEAAHCHVRGPGGHAQRCPQALVRTVAQGGGDVSTTAADMAPFMSALLTPGALLQEATLRRMEDFDTERFHPRLPGLGLAIMQMDYAGRAAAGHRGDINGFVSKLVLFPNSNLGVFISVNGSSGEPPRPRLSTLFHRAGAPGGPQQLDPDAVIDNLIGAVAVKFVPVSSAAPSRAVVAHELSAEQLAGAYFRRDATRGLFGRIMATVSALHIGVDDKHRLLLAGCAYERRSAMYYECGHPSGGPHAVGFRADGGRILAGVESVGAMQRQPWWRTAAFAVLPAPLLLILGLSALVRAPFERRRPVRRVLLIAGACSLAIAVAVLLELQFGYELGHTASAMAALTWRWVFPVAALALVANAVLAVAAIRTGDGEGASLGVVQTGYLALLATAGLGLAWLSVLWWLL